MVAYRDNIDCTSQGAAGIVEDHILAAAPPSFVDKGNIHMPQGWGDTSVFGLARRPVVGVGEEKVVHNPLPERASAGMAKLDNMLHMDNHQLELQGKENQLDLEVVERGVVT